MISSRLSFSAGMGGQHRMSVSIKEHLRLYIFFYIIWCIAEPNHVLCSSPLLIRAPLSTHFFFLLLPFWFVVVVVEGEQARRDPSSSQQTPS